MAPTSSGQRLTLVGTLVNGGQTKALPALRSGSGGVWVEDDGLAGAAPDCRGDSDWGCPIRFPKSLPLSIAQVPLGGPTMVVTAADRIARPSCDATLRAGTLIPQDPRRGGLPAPTPSALRGREPSQHRDRSHLHPDQPGGIGLKCLHGRWWLALCCALGLVFASPAGAARILVLVHGYLGDSASWRQNGVLPVLEQAGWEAAGNWQSTRAGVRLEPVGPPAGEFAVGGGRLAPPGTTWCG